MFRARLGCGGSDDQTLRQASQVEAAIESVGKLGEVAMLDAVLAFGGVEQSVGLVKSRAILAGYFIERGLAQELELVEASLRNVTPAVLEKARRGILSVQDRVFWELNDRGLNFDFVEPQRRARVTEVFDRVSAGTG